MQPSVFTLDADMRVNIVALSITSVQFLLNYMHAFLFSVGATFTSAISSGSMIAQQNKQIKEALFKKKVQQDMKEEQTNHLKW